VRKRRGLHTSSQHRAAAAPNPEEDGGAAARAAAGSQHSASTGSMESARSFSDEEGEHNEGVSQGPAAQRSRQAAVHTRGGPLLARGGRRGSRRGSGRGPGRGRGSTVSTVPPSLEESRPVVEHGQQVLEERSLSHAGQDSTLVTAAAAAAERSRRGRSDIYDRANQGAASGSSIHREATNADANVPKGSIAQQPLSLDGDRPAGLRGRGNHVGHGSRGGATMGSMRQSNPMHAASRRTLDQGLLSRKRRASGGEPQQLRPQRLKRPTAKAAGTKQPKRRKRRRLKRLYNNEVRKVPTSMHACYM
jgi:hypothetical protein